eukprot:3068679-Rhodomonas_salina.1
MVLAGLVVSHIMLVLAGRVARHARRIRTCSSCLLLLLLSRLPWAVLAVRGVCVVVFEKLESQRGGVK